jgi:hypothetical protein
MLVLESVYVISNLPRRLKDSRGIISQATTKSQTTTSDLFSKEKKRAMYRTATHKPMYPAPHEDTQPRKHIDTIRNLRETRLQD